MEISIHISKAAAIAIDQLNNSVMDEWVNYIVQFYKYPRKRK